MSLLSREQIRQMIKEKNLKSAEDVQDTLKEMTTHTLQEMLEAELDHSLGYEKHDVKKQVDEKQP